MKKTKLLTSLAALALVLSLGACTEPTEETTSEETSEVETTDTTTSEEAPDVAYAIVGDFADSTWKESPATDSIYYIPAGTTHYEVTVTIDEAPTENESWTDENQWDAGLSVVEYGTWNRVIAFSELDKKSTGVGETAGTDNNIVVNWGSTYHLFIDFGETNSILVKEIEDNTITEMLGAIEEDCNYYAENTYLVYESDVLEEPASVTMSPYWWFECDEYATEDALYIDYWQIKYANGSQGYGYYMYYMDAELYVNDYENNQTLVYYVDSTQGNSGLNGSYQWILALADTCEGTWEDNIWSLADLAPYRYAFTTTFSYYGYEMYDVDESALDTVIAATVGNNYLWDDLFTDGSGNYGGFGDWYFGYPDYVDAVDIFAGVEVDDAYGIFTDSPLVKFSFDDGGGWYTTTGGYYAMEVMAHTDIDLESVGTTSLPTTHYTIA